MPSDDDRVFKALADPTRRSLLDRLLGAEGLTLGQLESELAMTRFGVMKHLKVLEEADLVLTRRSGREKLHFLNPVPIRLVHDRWIDKYTEQRVAALADLKTALEGITMNTRTAQTTETRTTQMFRVQIKATPEAVWTAITSPGWNQRYGYRVAQEYDLTPGGTFRALSNDGMKQMGMPDEVIEGEVLEADPPRRLVQTWRMLFDPSQAAEPFTTLTWEIDDAGHGVTRLTLTHDLTDAPIHAAMVNGDSLEQGGGGWPFILSDLKSLLETGDALLSDVMTWG